MSNAPSVAMPDGPAPVGDHQPMPSSACSTSAVSNAVSTTPAPRIAAGCPVPRFEDVEERGGSGTRALSEQVEICLCVDDRLALTPKVNAFMDYLVEHLPAAWRPR